MWAPDGAHAAWLDGEGRLCTWSRATRRVIAGPPGGVPAWAPLAAHSTHGVAVLLGEAGRLRGWDAPSARRFSTGVKQVEGAVWLGDDLVVAGRHSLVWLRAAALEPRRTRARSPRGGSFRDLVAGPCLAWLDGGGVTVLPPGAPDGGEAVSPVRWRTPGRTHLLLAPDGRAFVHDGRGFLLDRAGRRWSLPFRALGAHAWGPEAFFAYPRSGGELLRVPYGRGSGELLALPRLPAGPADEIQALAWSRDGSHLRVGTLDGEVHALDVRAALSQEGAGTSPWRAHPEQVHEGAVTTLISLPRPGQPDLVLSAGGDGVLRASEARSEPWGALTAPARAADGERAVPILAVAAAPEVRTAARLDARGAILIVAADAGPTPARALAPHAAVGKTLAFDRRGRWLASGGADGRVALFRRGADGWFQETVCALPPAVGGFTEHVHALAFAPRAAELWVGTLSGTLWRLRRSDLAVLGSIRVHQASIEALAFDPLAPRLAAVGAEGCLALVACGGAEKMGTILARVRPEGSGTLTEVAWSPDGRLLATAGQDGRVRLLDGRSLAARATTPSR